MLEVRLIGTFDIKYDGKPVIISSRIAQSLFAYLVLNAGKSHRREKLAGMFWPDTAEEKARAYLRHELWRIRKALSTTSKVEYLISADINLSFNSSADYWLDANLLKELSKSASVDELVKSLSIFQGELLPGFYDEWIVLEREYLQTVFEQNVSQLLELLESEKRWSNILDWAENWISFGQGPEAAYRYLMIAYEALGDPVRLTSTYERCGKALRALDLEPSEQTRALAYKRNSKINIPIPLTSFIGREKELQEVAELLSKSRLVTLTGSGGVGKTRLAIQVVADVLDRFPEGIWFLDLAPLSDPSLVPNTLANLLGLRESSDTKLSFTDLLINYFRSRTALVIFDNCEHLIESCAQLVHLLLTSCGNLSILATSREALRVSGEIPCRVPSLEIPQPDMEFAIDELSNMESVRLFAERAATVSPTFAINQQNALAIAQICKRLDGIPLAIELAAVRTNMLTVEQILKRLDDRFNLLSRGLRSALPRHQTLRAMIEWSYDLLTEKERLLFTRLAVFMGGWTLEAAQQVCSGDGVEPSEILDLLSYLVNKSLMLVENLNGEIRYQSLETIRQFAREKLQEAGQAEMIHHRHLAYFVDLAERAEPNLRAFDMVIWLDRLETELGNIREALTWASECDVEAYLLLASAVLWFWHIRGHKLEGIDWLERGLSIEAAKRGNQPLTPRRAMIRGKALNASGSLIAMTFDVRKAIAYLEESLRMFQKLGEAGKQGMAYALMMLARLPTGSNRTGSLLERSLSLFREIGDKFGTAECLMELAGIAHRDDNYKQAIIFAEEELSLSREIGDQDGIATALLNLGDIALAQEDYQLAITLVEEGKSLFHNVGNQSGIGMGLSGLGDIFFWQGDYERAMKIYGESLTLAQEIGDRFLGTINLYSMGFIAWFRGDYVRANQVIMESLTAFRDIGHDWLTASTLHALGDIALAQGEDMKAIQWYEAELAFGQEANLNLSPTFALCGSGRVAWAKGNYETATKKFEGGLKMSREAGFNHGRFHALYGLGRVAQSQGEYAAAREYYVEMWEIQRQRINPLFKWNWLKTYVCAIAYPIGAFAVLAATRNQWELSIRLLGAAETLYTPLCFEMSAKERGEHEQAISAARAGLSEEGFAVAYDEGKKLTIDEAITYALEELQ